MPMAAERMCLRVSGTVHVLCSTESLSHTAKKTLVQMRIFISQHPRSRADGLSDILLGENYFIYLYIFERCVQALGIRSTYRKLFINKLKVNESFTIRNSFRSKKLKFTNHLIQS